MYSMNYHPVHLIGKLDSIFKGIFLYTVDTYEKIAGNPVPFTIVKSNIKYLEVALT